MRSCPRPTSTTPTRRDQRARRRPRRRRARRRVLRRRGRLDRLHPPRLHARASRSRRPSAATPRCASSCSPSTASSSGADSVEEAYRRTIAVVNRAAEFVNERAAGAPRFGGPLHGAPPLDARARRERLREILPSLRGALSEERSKLLAVDVSPARRRVRRLGRARRTSSRSAPPAPITSSTPSGCRCGSRSTPRPSTLAVLPERIAERAAAYRDAYRALRRASRRRDHRARGSRRPRGPDPGPRRGRRRRDRGRGANSRDLYRRAIEVMAGANALDRLRLADGGRELRRRVLAARALQAVAGAAAGASCRARSR